MDKLKIVKTIVVILTFLLVFGLLAAGGTIYKKIAASAPKPVSMSLAQPDGSTIESFKLDGGRLWILVKGGAKPDRILAVNPARPQDPPAEIHID